MGGKCYHNGGKIKIVVAKFPTTAAKCGCQMIFFPPIWGENFGNHGEDFPPIWGENFCSKWQNGGKLKIGKIFPPYGGKIFPPIMGGKFLELSSNWFPEKFSPHCGGTYLSKRVFLTSNTDIFHVDPLRSITQPYFVSIPGPKRWNIVLRMTTTASVIRKIQK